MRRTLDLALRLLAALAIVGFIAFGIWADAQGPNMPPSLAPHPPSPPSIPAGQPRS